MSMIEEILKHRPGFVGYLVAGDGGMARSKAALLALVAGGVNLLEIGVPFSDPVADGPTIQAAAARALKDGTTLEKVFLLIRDLKREINTPIVLFSYYNPILNAGPGFYHRAKQVGVDGCLIVDLPLEESEDYQKACINASLDPVFLISPTTSVERIKKIAACSRGMLYYVTRSGTTGVQNTLPLGLKERLQTIRSMTALPVVAGFGISNREMAKAVLDQADGFVVGSLFVKAVADNKTPEEIKRLAQNINPHSNSG